MGDVLKELEWVNKVAIEVATGKHFGRTPHETARAIVALFPTVPPSVRAMREALEEIAREQSAKNGTAADDRFQSIARAALASGPAETVLESETLPCDVMVAPATLIRAGCNIKTLLISIDQRRMQGRTFSFDAPPDKLMAAPPTPSHDGEITEALTEAMAEALERRLVFVGKEMSRILQVALIKRGLAILPIPAPETKS